MKYKAILLILIIHSCYGCKNDNFFTSFERDFRPIAYVFFVNTSFTFNDETKIKLLLNTKRPSCVIDANFLIAKNKDTTYVPLLLKDAFDYSCSTGIENKGTSVYQSKMHALKNISGLQPPKTISRKPDSVNIKFYLNWAINKGYKL